MQVPELATALARLTFTRTWTSSSLAAIAHDLSISSTKARSTATDRVAQPLVAQPVIDKHQQSSPTQPRRIGVPIYRQAVVPNLAPRASLHLRR
ncbi:hypothetical protein J1614_000571 [Plenodomus biglobosus]|nr:hypothetical protein J1614_000571 [Plenodomus biglobosus]